VFHLAAQSYPKTSFDSPLDTLETNIQGTAHVMEALRKNDIKAISHVCASSEVFGRVSRDKLPIDEECTFHPASPYAISKVGTDLVGRYYAEAYGMVVMTTRMFTHTGPRRGDVFAESTFAKQIAMIEAGLIPPVVKTGNLDSLRTFADVRDAVRAYYMLVTVNPVSGAYYNIGGTYSCSVGDMLRTLLDLSTVKDIRVETDPERLRPIDADLQVPNTAKFKAVTGWEPEISFEQTMGDLLQYWRDRVAAGEVFLTR
jgi:GDPmannose 4,6-dehydratase